MLAFDDVVHPECPFSIQSLYYRSLPVNCFPVECCKQVFFELFPTFPGFSCLFSLPFSRLVYNTLLENNHIFKKIKEASKVRHQIYSLSKLSTCQNGLTITTFLHSTTTFFWNLDSSCKTCFTLTSSLSFYHPSMYIFFLWFSFSTTPCVLSINHISGFATAIILLGSTVQKSPRWLDWLSCFPLRATEAFVWMHLLVCACISVHEGVRVYSTELDVVWDRRTNICNRCSREWMAVMKKTAKTTGMLLHFNCIWNHFKDRCCLLHFYTAPRDCSKLSDDSSSSNTSERNRLETCPTWSTTLKNLTSK